MQQLTERYLAAKRALFDRAYSDLNDEQRTAVFAVNDPLLVIAGAGSGKTTVLVKRIAFIMNLYSSPQTSRIRIVAGGEKDLGEIRMNAMEVRAVEL